MNKQWWLLIVFSNFKCITKCIVHSFSHSLFSWHKAKSMDTLRLFGKLQLNSVLILVAIFVFRSFALIHYLLYTRLIIAHEMTKSQYCVRAFAQRMSCVFRVNAFSVLVYILSLSTSLYHSLPSFLFLSFTFIHAHSHSNSK